MQGSLARRALFNLARTQINAIEVSLLSSSSILNASPVNTISLSNTLSRSFSEQSGQFEKISSYESLISRISNAGSVNDLLNVMNQNVLLYKNEHLVLTLRVLARLIKNTPPAEVEKLAQDERYTKLTQKAQESIEQFNEFEILDFLFWLRRFRMARINHNISEESIDKLFNMIKEFVKNKSFNFRNLVNLFYDLSYLNKNTDDIAIEILLQVKEDPKLLTPFTVVQLLQASSRRGAVASPRQYSLIDFVARSIPNLLQEFDSDHKCSVFKHLSALELNLNPPKFRLPNVLYTLRTQLKESLDNLSESGVINILEGYEDLSIEFPTDLLEEIKEMVIITIQHNSVNIKSFFLLDFLERMSRMKRTRRLNEEKITVIYEEITKRLLNDEYLGRFRNIERLVEIYDRVGLRNEALMKKILERINENTQPVFSGPIFQALLQHKLDISAALDKFLASDYPKTFGINNLARLFVVLTQVPGDKYAAQLAEIKGRIAEKPEQLQRVIPIIAASGVDNEPTNELLKSAVEHLRKSETNDSFNFFKTMFQSSANKTLRLEWNEYAKTHFADLKAPKLNRLIDSFLSLEEYPRDQLNLFVFIITQVLKPENIPLRKITSALKDNKDFVIELMRSEAKLKSVLSLYLNLLEVHKAEVRHISVFGVVKRLENLGVKLNILNSIAKKGFDVPRANKAPTSNQIELVYAIHLMDRNLLRGDDARKIYNSNKATMNDINLAARFFSYILKRTPAEELAKDDIAQEVREKLEVIHKSLSETNARTVLSALTTILSFPPQFLLENKDLYLKSVKEFIGFGNQTLYTNLVLALPSDQVRSHYDFYVPFMREIISNYGNYNKRMSGTDVVKILKKFADCGTRNPSIYNYLLADIGRLFNSLRAEEHTEIVSAFTKLSIKQSDLFDKIVNKINQNPFAYINGISVIVFSFYKVGYDTPQVKNLIPEIFGKFKLQKTENLFPFLAYIATLELPNEAELIENIIGRLDKGEVSQRAAVNVYEFLKYCYKNKPEYAEKVKTLIGNFDDSFANAHKDRSSKTRKTVADYLKAMNVNFQEDFVAGDLKADLYIPEKKTIIKILSRQDANFDKLSLTGPAMLTKRIYNSLEGYKSVFVNIPEFYSIPEHMSKVNYLISIGIENQNTSGMYDFSHIEKEHQAEEETVSVKAEEEEAVGAEEEVHEEDKEKKN